MEEILKYKKGRFGFGLERKGGRNLSLLMIVRCPKVLRISLACGFHLINEEP